MAVIPGTHMDDVSEFQNMDWDAYARVRNCVIIRAAYGSYHDDLHWSNNQVVRDGRFKVVGIYLYFVAGQDAVQQANHFADLVGPLKDGEFLIIDIEEGGGDQQGRLDAALAVLNSRTQRETGEYSYVPFIQAHLGGFSSNGERIRWVAGYGNEPTIAWDLWQHTDGQYGNHDCQPAYPGAPACDCSVFRGTADQLHALVMRGTTAAPGPTAPQPITVTGDPDVAQIIPLVIATDGNGNGDNIVDVPVNKVFAVTPNGQDPEANHAYSPIPRCSKSQFNNQTKIEIEGAPANGQVLVWLTIAA